MVKWWVRCFCLQTEVTKPRQLPLTEGTVDATAKASPGRVQISPLDSNDKTSIPFNDISDIRHLEELLEEITNVCTDSLN